MILGVEKKAGNFHLERLIEGISTMNFIDHFVSSVHRFSVGKEVSTGKYYLSIPVSNGFVDYEEYYEITAPQSEHFTNDLTVATGFAEECRRRMRDDLLIVKPGSNRGVAA
jgi:hypothetical protein